MRRETGNLRARNTPRLSMVPGGTARRGKTAQFVNEPLYEQSATQGGRKPWLKRTLSW